MNKNSSFKKNSRLKKTYPSNLAKPPLLLPKCPTGIKGLDEITGGGFPLGRPTLVCGGAGCGKTLLSLEFLVRGATVYKEKGVFVAFEETEAELKANVASLGFDLDGLVRQKKILVDYMKIEKTETKESGLYDLEGLFVRLNDAIVSIGAKRVVFDTLEVLFGTLPNKDILRGELRRLFQWLKDKGVTAVITAEPGLNLLTRFGLEEYVADCVLILDHRIQNQVATRHLRVMKYRGSQHGTNEFPFLISSTGISLLPITSLSLNYKVSTERIGTGIPRLDKMLGGKGFFRASSVLLSGTAGTGKTSVAANFAQAACTRGERVLFVSFEESPGQILRNMKSIGLNLQTSLDKNLLMFHSVRPSQFGLELHLATLFDEIEIFKPEVVVVDPITSLMELGTASEGTTLVTKLVDYLKANKITSLFTGHTTNEDLSQQTIATVTSPMDAWLTLEDVEGNGERNRVFYVLKSRGMAHSNQVREFLISDRGIDIVDAYIGAEGVLTGSARAAQADVEKAAALLNQQDASLRKRELQRKQEALERQISGLRSDYEAEALELVQFENQLGSRMLKKNNERVASETLRQADKKVGKLPLAEKIRNKGK